MNKKRLFILTALMLTICLVFTMFAVACDKTNKPNEDDDTSDSSLLFTNGTFSSTADDSELSSPNSWTAAVGSSSSSSATPSGDSNLRAGVVSTATKAWRSLKRKYSDITIDSPGRGISSENGDEELNDDDVLMIYNKVATSYKYTSTSHTLDINSYYKLSIDVKTMLDSDNTDELAGAYITVSGSAEAAWEAINTQGEWKTYTLYIETSELASGTISVVLSNGIGANNSSGHMSKGYAFFDNVVLEKVSEVDEDDADAAAFTKADYDKVQVNGSVAKYSMKTANAEFDFASSTTSVPYTPSKYTLVAGFGSGDNASTSSTYTARGIIDTKNFDKEASSLSHLTKSLQSENKTLADLKTPEASVGTRMLYMQNKEATAFGYRSSVAMNFNTNKFYEVSIWARTYITQGNATIRLTDGTNDDSNGYVLTADSHDQWTKYTFYVQANQFRATSLYLELWLGFGGQDDKDTLAVGAVLFDSLSLNEITSEQYNAQSDTSAQKKISLYTSEENMEAISLDNFDIQNQEDVIAGTSTFKTFNKDNFVADDYFKEYPGMPINIENSDIFTSDVLAINNYYPSATVLSTLTAPQEDEDISAIDTDKLLHILPNKAYAISMYIKTKDVDASKGLTVSLLKLNEDYKGKDFSKMYTSVSSFSNLNTENLESFKVESDYTLISFYVLGAEIEETRLAISISLGSGDGTDYSTLAMGYGYVSSIYLEKITYSNYTSASSNTVINKVSLASSGSSSEVSSNGFFNYTDISSTINLFGDDWMDTPVLGLPTGWSSTDSSKITKPNADEPVTDYANMAGILNLDNGKQLTQFGITDIANFYEGAQNVLSYENNKNVLAIKKDGSMDMLGFKSNSISLSANSFYEFKVWAKANDGDIFSIVLRTASSIEESYKYGEIVGDGKWHEYSIFVETGISSVSVTLTLAAGYEGASSSIDSTVFFSHLTYGSVNETVFENATKNETEDLRFLTQTWLVDSFDDIDSDNSVVAPKNFSGALVDTDASSDEDTLTAGVIDKNRTNFSDIGLDTDKDEDLAIYNAIFNNSETNIGDRVLVIYNKSNTSYAYTSNSATISGGKYYKISIWVLTYKLAATDTANNDGYFKPTATITLKANNKTYEFGRRLKFDSSDYDKLRLVNTSTYEDGVEKIGKWTEYAFYIYAEDDISSTTATLSVGLGFNSEDYRMSGYVFVDNFSVVEIDEDDFIKRQVQYGEDAEGNYYKDGDNYVEITDATPAPSGATRYKQLTDSEVAKLDNSLNSTLTSDEAAKQNFRIVFTSDDSNAEPVDDDTPTDDDTKKDTMKWVYISIGAVSGVIVIIVVIYLIKKFAPKRKKKLVKGSKGARASGSSNSKRDQFGK